MFSLPVTLLLFLLRAPFSSIFSDPRCADLFYILLFSLSFTSVYSVIRGSFWGNKRFFAYSLIELIEELIKIAVGVFLLLGVTGSVADVNKAAVAVLVSYLCSFTLALLYFFVKGGRLRSPRGELLPLLRASAPVTAMRASNSLINSVVSVIFPMRLMAAGVSSAQAMSAYGVVYGMVMPVLMTPGTLIGSIALVLVPELSESFYKGQKEKVSRLVSKALSTALLIAAALVPFFLVCGESVGIFLYSNAESGKLITRCALILIPMSLTMISTSILNSMNCEKYTLFFFLAGSAAMLLCVFFLPPLLGSDALTLGMALDFLITAVCSLVLLKKRTGRLYLGKYCLRLLSATLPAAALGFLVYSLGMRHLSYVPAALLSALVIAAVELVLFRLFHLFDPRRFLSRFFEKRRKKSPSVS